MPVLTDDFCSSDAMQLLLPLCLALAVELASVIEVVSMSASKQNDHHVYSITASEYDRLVAKTEEVRASMPESAGSRRDMLAPASRPPPSIRDVDVITLPARTTAPVGQW